jgi:hypothetical protein
MTSTAHHFLALARSRGRSKLWVSPAVPSRGALVAPARAPTSLKILPRVRWETTQRRGARYFLYDGAAAPDLRARTHTQGPAIPGFPRDSAL